MRVAGEQMTIVESKNGCYLRPPSTSTVESNMSEWCVNSAPPDPGPRSKGRRRHGPVLQAHFVRAHDAGPQSQICE
jgi:hypothetical protein